MTIAADMCVYTNHNFIELELTSDDDESDGSKK